MTHKLMKLSDDKKKKRDRSLLIFFWYVRKRDESQILNNRQGIPLYSQSIAGILISFPLVIF